MTGVETLAAAIGNRTYVYVKVSTDEGIVGIGEAGCSDKERALLGAIDELRHYLLGANPLRSKNSGR